jgi:thiamine pyrophosphate-dependent acetolactate synthase large subunit-like protein
MPAGGDRGITRFMLSGLADALRYAGVERVYGVVEDRLKPIAETIAGIDGIAWVEVRNDQAAALSAADEALSSGQLAVCAGSYGSESTYLLRGLYDAHRTGAPVLAVASHVSNTDSDDGPSDEIHAEWLFAECSNYCGLVSDPTEMPWLARTAIQHALVRGGVSVLMLDPPAATTVRHPVDYASGRICEQAIAGRQPVARVRGLPLDIGCAVTRRWQRR